eukprot:SAG11_NODE_18334_length_494_cov_0.643038_1_plen_49_part_01
MGMLQAACVDPTREEVWEVLEALLAEVATLFPDSHVHGALQRVSQRLYR